MHEQSDIRNTSACVHFRVCRKTRQSEWRKVHFGVTAITTVFVVNQEVLRILLYCFIFQCRRQCFCFCIWRYRICLYLPYLSVNDVWKSLFRGNQSFLMLGCLIHQYADALDEATAGSFYCDFYACLLVFRWRENALH